MSNRRISDAGLQLIKDSEGLRLVPYRDSVGVWTDGYGNTHGVVPNGPPITEAKATADLLRNLEMAEAAANTQITVDLTQGQFDALVDFAYAQGVKELQSGQTGYRAKLDLGHRLVPLFNVFHHDQTAMHVFFRAIGRRITWRSLDRDLANHGAPAGREA